MILGVSGLGLERDKVRIQKAMNYGPDVVFVGICPSRLFLLTYGENGRRGRSTFKSALLYVLWLRLIERIPRLCGHPDIPSQDVFTDLNEAVLLAAEKDCRVVFGDRDFLRIIGRAWETLSFLHKVYVLFELILCSILPKQITMRIFVDSFISVDFSGDMASGGGDDDGGDDDMEGEYVSEEGFSKERDRECSPPFDALSALLDHFSLKYPSVIEIKREQDEYSIGSIERLDLPLSKLCPSSKESMEESSKIMQQRRPKVLIITGSKTSQNIREWFENGRISQSAEIRRKISHTKATTMTPSFLFPFCLSFLLIGIPLLYFTLLFHQHILRSFFTQKEGASVSL